MRAAKSRKVHSRLVGLSLHNSVVNIPSSSVIGEKPIQTIIEAKTRTVSGPYTQVHGVKKRPRSPMIAVLVELVINNSKCAVNYH